MGKVKTSLDWKWSENVKPTDETFGELFTSLREQTIKNNGRLLTEEEALQITDEIRKELREKREK